MRNKRRAPGPFTLFRVRCLERGVAEYAGWWTVSQRHERAVPRRAWDSPLGGAPRGNEERRPDPPPKPGSAARRAEPTGAARGVAQRLDLLERRRLVAHEHELGDPVA